jgi:hypothetical protein
MATPSLELTDLLDSASTSSEAGFVAEFPHPVFVPEKICSGVLTDRRGSVGTGTMLLGPRERGGSLKLKPAKLLVLHKEPTKGRLDRFDDGTGLGTWISVGRQSDSEVMVNDFSVSKVHARVRSNPEGFEIEDLGSNNGTTLNGVQLSAGVVAPLRSGDRIRFGRVQMRFYSTAALYRLLPNSGSGQGPSTT